MKACAPCIALDCLKSRTYAGDVQRGMVMEFTGAHENGTDRHEADEPASEPESALTPAFLIVDDHEIVRFGLKRLLLQGFGRCTFGEAGSGREALKEFDRRSWTVVILDITLPDRNGLEVLNEMRMRRPEVPILVVSALPESELAVRVMKTGAAGFVPKETCAKEIIGAIRKAVTGGRYISPTLADLLAWTVSTNPAEAPHATLSDREYTVLKMLGAGSSVGEIAASLCISPKTVSTYRAHILQKMNLKTTADLIRYAVKQRLVE